MTGGVGLSFVCVRAAVDKSIGLGGAIQGNSFLIAFCSLVLGGLAASAGEFPDSWTWDKDPENRALHAALIRVTETSPPSRIQTLPRACIVPRTLGPAIVKADCIRFRTQAELSERFLNVALNSQPVRRRPRSMRPFSDRPHSPVPSSIKMLGTPRRRR